MSLLMEPQKVKSAAHSVYFTVFCLLQVQDQNHSGKRYFQSDVSLFFFYSKNYMKQIFTVDFLAFNLQVEFLAFNPNMLI